VPLLYTKPIDKQGIIGLWNITENTEELFEQLPTSQDMTEFEHFSHPTRQKTWLASRLLAFKTAHQFREFPKNLVKNQYNQPYFVNSSLNISISHTATKAVVFLHKTQKIGIDIETIHPKLRKIAHRVLSFSELEQTDSLKKITQFWCAKEAIYKWYAQKEVNFREDIQISYTSEDTPYDLVGYFKKVNPIVKLQLYSKQIDNQIFVYCLKASENA